MPLAHPFLPYLQSHFPQIVPWLALEESKLVPLVASRTRLDLEKVGVGEGRLSGRFLLVCLLEWGKISGFFEEAITLGGSGEQQW